MKHDFSRMSRARRQELIKNNPEYFSSEDVKAHKAGAKEARIPPQVDSRSPDEKEADYQAALARQEAKKKTAKKNYSHFKSAWYSHSLRTYSGVLNDVSVRQLSIRVEEAYKALRDYARETEVRLDLSSRKALKVVKSIRESDHYTQAIKDAFLKIRKDQAMGMDGLVKGPALKKLRVNGKNKSLLKYLDIS